MRSATWNLAGPPVEESPDSPANVMPLGRWIKENIVTVLAQFQADVTNIVPGLSKERWRTGVILFDLSFMAFALALYRRAFEWENFARLSVNRFLPLLRRQGEELSFVAVAQTYFAFQSVPIVRWTSQLGP